MGNNQLILAGTDSTTLAYFGATTATAPTDANTPVAPAASAGWYDAGLITEDGVSNKFDTSTKKIKAAGSNLTQRTLVTEEEVTFELTFLEHNVTSTVVFDRQAVGAYTAGVDGQWARTHGGYSQQLYSAIFDIVDGSNLNRVYVPELEVTERKERKLGASGEALTLGVTITAYPDANGNSMYEWTLMNALATP